MFCGIVFPPAYLLYIFFFQRFSVSCKHLEKFYFFLNVRKLFSMPHQPPPPILLFRLSGFIRGVLGIVLYLQLTPAFHSSHADWVLKRKYLLLPSESMHTWGTAWGLSCHLGCRVSHELGSDDAFASCRFAACRKTEGHTEALFSFHLLALAVLTCMQLAPHWSMLGTHRIIDFPEGAQKHSWAC